MFRLVLPKTARLLIAAGLLATFAAQPVAASTMAAQLPGDPAMAMQIAAEQSLLDLTNADRVANGLAPLEFDPDTLAIARERAASQLGTSSLSHYNADGSLAFVGLLADAHVDYQLAGENLARASAESASTASDVEQALMKSPAHRKNILEKEFSRVAIGVATDTTGQITFAEVYRN